MRKIWNKGHRIRASDKHLVYHFSIGTLLFVFVAVLLLLNIKQLMQSKVGCDYISDLPSYKRKVWHEMKRLNPADYEERQLEDFSKYVFGMSYQTLKDVMKQQKGREEQCRKQGCWWKREEQLAKKQYHTGLNCR